MNLKFSSKKNHLEYDILGDFFMKLGLCLAGGGIKGAAHIGAIKALREAGVHFEYISGTSSGSIVATLYACGYSTDEIYVAFKKYAKKIGYWDWNNVWNVSKHFLETGKVKLTGLNSGKSIYDFAHRLCRAKGIQNINQVPRKLIIPTVNIYTEELYVFHSGPLIHNEKNIKYINNVDIGTAVQASCSYPGVFCPCEYRDTLLVDGGLAENLPWRETKRIGADKVVSIVFVEKTPKKCCDNVVQILDKSFGILCHELARYEWDGTDYLLEIETNNVGLLDWKKVDELYEQGYEQTKQKIKNWLSEITC